MHIENVTLPKLTASSANTGSYRLKKKKKKHAIYTLKLAALTFQELQTSAATKLSSPKAAMFWD